MDREVKQGNSLTSALGAATNFLLGVGSLGATVGAGHMTTNCIMNIDRGLSGDSCIAYAAMTALGTVGFGCASLAFFGRTSRLINRNRERRYGITRWNEGDTYISED